MVDFSKLKPLSPDERARQAAEREAAMRAEWNAERRAKIRHDIVLTRAADEDVHTTMTQLGERRLGFQAKDPAGRTIRVGWLFHADDERVRDVIMERLAIENVGISAKGYWRPNARGREPDQKPEFIFEIVEAELGPILSVDRHKQIEQEPNMNAHAPVAASASPTPRAPAGRQVRLPIDDFHLTSPGPMAARDFVAALQPHVVEGLKLLPQWPAIERLGEFEKWSRNMCWRMLDEARALDPSEDPLQITKNQADAATKNLTWHLRRMSGIGGSEIGVLVIEGRGERPPFETTARDIIAKKLCLGLPDRGNVHMMRGKRAEEFLRKFFMEDHPQARRDEAALKITASGRPAAHPWLIGSPDEVILTKDEEGLTRRIIVDYKAPGEAAMTKTYKEGPSFDYVCQLHHYGIVASVAGVGAHGFMLAPWDSRKFELATFDIPVNIDLMREIMRTAKAVWNDNVMAGVLPPEKAATAISKDGLRDPAADLAVLDAMSKVIDERKKAIITSLETELLARRASGEADFGPWKVKAETVYDDDMLRQMAVAFGVEPAAFETPDLKKIDKEACVAIVKDVLDALKVRDMSEQQLPGTGERAFRAAMDGVEERLRDGVPMAKVFDAAGLAAAVGAAGGDATPAASVTASFTASRKKDHFRLLKEFREDVDSIIAEGANFCQEAIFARWPELANSETTDRMAPAYPGLDHDAA